MKIIQVGSGGWALGWLRAIQDAHDCELVALVSRGGDNLANAIREWRIPADRCFTHLEDALTLDADAVLVSVPHFLHLRYAEAALRAGKHVLIEKPLADDFAQAKEFAAHAAGGGKQAWVSQNFRYRQALWDLRASLGRGGDTVGNDGGNRDGESTRGGSGAGAPQWLEVYFRRGTNSTTPQPWQLTDWRQKQWSFLVNEIMIHHIDMIRFLLGREPISVRAEGWNPRWARSPGPELVTAQIELEGDVRVSYRGTTEGLGLQTGWEGDWLVQTDLGSVRWDAAGLTLTAAEHETPHIVHDASFPGSDRAGVLAELGRAIRGERTSLPTASDNVKSLAAVRAVERSLRCGETVSVAAVLAEPAQNGA